MTSSMSFDPESLAAYQRAAAKVSALLGEAATATTQAAGADLSRLGVIGREFAAAWNQSAIAHAATLTTAGTLVSDYQKILAKFGETVTAVDTGVRDDLTTLESEIS